MTLAVTVEAVVPLEVFMIRYALAVLAAHDGNKTHAAKALGVSRFMLQRLCKRAATLGMAAR
ncbi:MAG TPA: helix-turn-helix domain-containing protein [Kofleriaceae bacterium]|nr:helix-turn-helix domain-containing protein [Kofleriaceae bacterium]